MSGVPDYLDYADQAMLLATRAGHEAVMQALWIYDHPVDPAGLQRFHHHLVRGNLGRLIARSPLPFGRHRWISAQGAPYTVADEAIARDSLYDWADRQVDLPLDPEHGPGWRLGAAPLAGGGTVVSLVVSHCIADGTAVARAIESAVRGDSLGTTHRQPRTRRASAAVSDLRRLGTDLPEIGHALRAAMRSLRDRRTGGQDAGVTAPSPGAQSHTIHLPTASLVTDVGSWDSRARELGGNRFALAAAVGACIGSLAGRERSGRVTLLVPISERVGDAAGNAVTLATVPVPTAGLTDDLAPARAALRQGIDAVRAHPDPMAALLPLIPFVPRRAVGALTDVAFGFGTDLPVSVSNMGVHPASVSCADGSPAEVFLFRGVDRNVSQAGLERRRGVLSVFAGAVGDQWALSVVGWVPGRLTTRDGLRDLLAEAVADLGIPGRLI